MMTLQIQKLTERNNEIQEKQTRQKYNYHEEYPQVGKTGVDTVHEKLPTEVYTMKKCLIWETGESGDIHM